MSESDNYFEMLDDIRDEIAAKDKRIAKLEAEHIRTPGDNPPPVKAGWDHSEMVLVYYAADPEGGHTSAWSIAYYHHKPPFDQKPDWVDFSHHRGTPDYWWPLPKDAFRKCGETGE